MKGFECQVVIEQDLISVSCYVTLGKSWHFSIFYEQKTPIILAYQAENCSDNFGLGAM